MTWLLLLGLVGLGVSLLLWIVSWKPKAPLPVAPVISSAGSSASAALTPIPPAPTIVPTPVVASVGLEPTAP